MIRRRAVVVLTIAGILFAPNALQAQRRLLEIDIVGGQERGLPIAVVPFGLRGLSTPPVDVASIIEEDLRRSGRFEPIARTDFLSNPTDDDINYKDFRLIKAEALVVGFIEPEPDGEYRMEFRLKDVFGERLLTGTTFSNVPPTSLRRQAHIISDKIFEALTGIKGAFDTQIAYVSFRKINGARSYDLSVSDYDGHNPQKMLTNTKGLLGVTWSPDRSQLAFVEQEADGTRSLEIATVQGVNPPALLRSRKPISSPAFSPDGRRLAFATYEFHGNSEIYIHDIATGRNQRLTEHPQIDIYPSWSPDGKRIVFTSNRSGKRQIYEIPASGGRANRLSFDGKENQQARFSPDGKSLVLITNQGNGDNVAILDLESKQTRILSDTRLDESPSFSPNGAMVTYSTKVGTKTYLRMVSVSGNFNYTLNIEESNVMEPSWAPFRPDNRIN